MNRRPTTTAPTRVMARTLSIVVAVLGAVTLGSRTARPRPVSP